MAGRDRGVDVGVLGHVRRGGLGQLFGGAHLFGGGVVARERAHDDAGLRAGRVFVFMFVVGVVRTAPSRSLW
jgi:hypothetical protein